MLQLKDLLRRKGMTAKELAVKIGISEGALSKSLSGNPTLERIEQIANALGVSIPELFAPQPTNTITCPHCGKLIKVEKGE
ncbi:helix-turn-helix domain-containing protein [Alistipes finegoldii]|jgi:transcriptional regulator with XRE-family HTH domain|nr:MAG TPA: helix-turn-helix domain protein [Caudoviricetes sp.]